MKTHINGMEITVDQIGSGPAILFIHDGSDNHAFNDPRFKALANAGYRVICTNLRGFHQRDTLALEDLTRDTVALLNYLGIGRAIVFGIGRGGYVLLDLLEKHPGRIAASSFVIPTTMADALRNLAGQDDFRLALQEGRFEQLKQALFTPQDGTASTGFTLAELPALRNWIETLAATQRHAARSCSSILAELQPPPVLIEATAPVNRKQGRFRRLRAFNAKLLALFDLLTPEAPDDYEAEDLAENN